MSVFGTNIAQSVAGSSQAERSQVQAKRGEEVRKAETRKRRDEVVVKTEAVEAARRLAGNDQEEAREDRHSHAQYTPGGQAQQDERARLDIEG